MKNDIIKPARSRKTAQPSPRAFSASCCAGARRRMGAGEARVLIAAAGLQTIDAETFLGELFFVFRHNIVLLAVVQIQTDILNQPAVAAHFLQCKLKQMLVVGLKMNLSVFREHAVVQCQKVGMGQTALALAVRRPGIGEIEIDAVDLSVGKNVGQTGGVKVQKLKVGEAELHRLFGCHNQGAFLALNGEIIDVRIPAGGLNDETALAAADLQMERVGVAEQRAPLSLVRSGSETSTGAQFARRVSRFFFFLIRIGILSFCFL